MPGRTVTMANPHDSAIAAHMGHLSGLDILAYLWQEHAHIQDDSAYWQFLAAAWIKSGTVVRLDYWRLLFESPRRNRHKLMKKGDRHVWRALPDPVHAYRAVAPGEDIDAIISWTLDRDRIRQLYRHREIVERDIPKARVVAYFDRRREREIIVL